MAGKKQLCTEATGEVFVTRALVVRIMDCLPPLEAATFSCVNHATAAALPQVAAQWSKLKFTHRPIPSVEHLRMIGEVAPNVKELWLECKWLPAGLMRVLQNWKQLEDLRLDHALFDDVDGIQHVESLKVVKLHECREAHPETLRDMTLMLQQLQLSKLAITLADGWLEDDACRGLKECCGELSEDLKTLEFGPIASSAVNSWGRNLPLRRVQAPSVPGCVEQLSMEVSTIDTTLVEDIVRLFPLLTEVHIRDNVPRSKSDLSDDDLQVLCRLPPLKKVSLVRTNGKFGTSDIGLMYLIAASSDTLEQVTLSGMPKLSDVTITALLKCPNLRQLHLQGCQQVGGHAFSPLVLGIHHLPSMVSVNLSHCSSLGDESIEALCELCPNLAELNLTDTSTADDAMASIAQLRVLKQLVLNGCHITDQGLELFADTVKQSQFSSVLNKLALRGCRAITDEGLLRLSDATVIPAITCLDVTGVVQLTDDGVLPLLESAKHLNQLKLRGCPKLSSRILAAIATEPIRRRLALLDVCHCEGMGNKQDESGITAITSMLANMNDFPSIQQLYLGCSGLKQEMMFAAMKTYVMRFCDMEDPSSCRYAQVLIYHFDDEIAERFDQQLNHELFSREDDENEELAESADDHSEDGETEGSEGQEEFDEDA